MRHFSGKTHKPVIFVLRSLKLGDFLVALPALKGLRRAYPDHELVLASPLWMEDIIEMSGVVDSLYPLGEDLSQFSALAKNTVDIAVNLHGNGPEAQAIVESLEARLTIAHTDYSSLDDTSLPWDDALSERERWCRLLRHYGIDADPMDVSLLPSTTNDMLNETSGSLKHHTYPKNMVVIHVGAAYPSRFWPEERFAQIVRALQQEGHHIVLTGDKKERQRAQRVADLANLPETQILAGKIPLTEFVEVISEATLVISVDTGAAHLASALSRPSIILFGPGTIQQWGPPPGPHHVLTYPELRVGDNYAHRPDPALLAVSAEEVLTLALQLLE